MLLIHRITPFLIGLTLAAGFFTFMSPLFHPAIPMAATLLIVGFLLGRLEGWKGKTLAFWCLVGVPLLFIFFAFGLSMFFELGAAKCKNVNKGNKYVCSAAKGKPRDYNDFQVATRQVSFGTA